MSSLIDLVGLLLEIVLYSIMVFSLFTWLASRRLRQHIDQVAKDLETERLIPITVEVDLEQYFCYNSITKAFVCQGRNMKEILERFRLRYPDKVVAIHNGDETAIRILKQQFKELDENSSSIRLTS